VTIELNFVFHHLFANPVFGIVPAKSHLVTYSLVSSQLYLSYIAFVRQQIYRPD
jgi:hypothetical protein